MAFDTKAPAHTYDFASISCSWCDGTLGYRPAGSADRMRCVACEYEHATQPPPAEPQPATLQALLDAWDHAAARALSGDSSVAIPRALFDAVADARKELP